MQAIRRIGLTPIRLLETFDDPAFGYIGQMAIDSVGRLFVGSVNGDCLSVIDSGARECFYSGELPCRDITSSFLS